MLSTIGNAVLAHMLGYTEGCQLWGGTRAGKGSASGLACSGVYVLRLCDPANPTVLEVSVVGKDVVWSLWQPLVADAQGRPLGVWSKVMPSAVENYVLFEKQFLEWYWVLAKMELLPIGCQLSCPLWANFCWTSQVMNVDGPSGSLSLDRKVYPEIPQASKLHGQVAQTLMSLTTVKSVIFP